MQDLLTILDTNTPLATDVDLFAYEIPLGTAGLWAMDRQVPSRFNGADTQEFSIYYRDKSKTGAMKNIRVFKNAIDNLKGSNGVCLVNGYELTILYTWDYIGKDAEGYFVFANALRLRR